MVAPDGQLADVAHLETGLGSQLRSSAVVVQTQHGGEVLGRQIRSRLHGDVGVGVGGVADHQHLHIARSHGVQGLALGGEDLGIGSQQVGTFHAGAARTGTDQQSVVGILEGFLRVAVGFDAGQQREGAVFQLHDHALQSVLSLFVGDFQQLQNNGLIFTQHFARGDAEQQGVTDLASCAGDGDTDGLLAHVRTPSMDKTVVGAGSTSIHDQPPMLRKQGESVPPI